MFIHDFGAAIKEVNYIQFHTIYGNNHMIQSTDIYKILFRKPELGAIKRNQINSSALKYGQIYDIIY